MSHKNCIQHEAVEKAKQMIKKIETQFGEFNEIFYESLTLTGVEAIDSAKIMYDIRIILNYLKYDIELQLLKNEDYVDGFCVTRFTKELKLVEELYKVDFFIRENYQKLEV